MPSTSQLINGPWEDVEWVKIDQMFDVSEKSLFALALAVGHDPALFFRGRNFSGLNLCGVDVRGIDFSDTDLTGTRISEAKIDETTILTGARIDDEDLAVLAKAGLREPARFDFSVESSQSLDLAELTLWPPRQGENTPDLPIYCDLRFGNETILMDRWCISVRAIRAEVVLSTKGLDIVHGTEFGERKIGPDKLDLAATGYPAAPDPIRRTESAALSNISHRRVPSYSGAELITSRVAQRPNNRWQIAEPMGNLSGTYLSAANNDQPLCRIVPQTDTFSVTITLVVKPQDLAFTVEPLDAAAPNRGGSIFRYASTKLKGFFELAFPTKGGQDAPPNKAAITKFLINRAIKSMGNDRRDDGSISLAQTTMQGQRRPR